MTSALVGIDSCPIKFSSRKTEALLRKVWWIQTNTVCPYNCFII
jgi:hypothetical protein